MLDFYGGVPKNPHALHWNRELEFKSVHSKLKWQNSRHKFLLRGPWSFSVQESLLGVSNILLKSNTYKSGKKFKGDLDRAHICSPEKSVLLAVQNPQQHDSRPNSLFWCWRGCRNLYGNPSLSEEKWDLTEALQIKAIYWGLSEWIEPYVQSWLGLYVKFHMT